MPDGAGQSALCRLQDAWRQALGGSASGWLAETDLHLTLRFFGDLAPAHADALAQASGSWLAAPAVDADFATVEAWPSRAPRLLVATFHAPPALSALAAAAERWALAQGGTAETRPFRAHVTLARSARPLPVLPQLKLGAFALPLRQLALMHRAAPAGAHRYAAYWRQEWPAALP